jgi:carboxypeptidase Taq
MPAPTLQLPVLRCRCQRKSNIPNEIAMGQFGTLHAWLREHLYQHGRKFKPNQLIERTTGEQMSVGPYLAYLRAKYGELYQLTAFEKL